MTIRMFFAVAVCVLMVCCAAMALAPDMPAQSRLRPPAVPLITCDPYFSVWSMNDKLTDGPTRHWTVRPQRMVSLARIDGKVFRLMGDEPKDIPAAHQVGLTVTPTRTLYEFEEDGVHMTMTFLTPRLPDDLIVCSWPVAYLTWTAKSVGGGAHEVSIYVDGSAELAVNEPSQVVSWKKGTAGQLTTLRVGTVEQPVLEARGDDRRIDWGYFYLAAGSNSAGILPAETTRASFAKNGNVDKLPAKLAEQDAAKDAPVLAMAFNLGSVSAAPASARVLLAYDDLYSIRYFNDDLRAYWRKDGASFDDLLQKADKDYEALTQRCEKFDDELIADMHQIGGDAYVQIGVLAWRQALAAQKICADANGQPLMFSKENFSNGCISTVDVLYPAAPQMIAFSPTMLKASLVPLMDYSMSPRWTHDSAPHDLGTYPHATGQVYGGGEKAIAMPVEESGNLLILMAALAKAEGNAQFSEKYWLVLTKWANYLKEKGLDPENQLCTDDFAGHIARNANLSAKAIMGIASYGMLADMLGKKEDAASAMATARDYAQKWMKMADDGDHYRLVFGEQGAGTWSQKYNIVWDKILGLNVFPPEVSQKEMAFYLTKMNRYGVPLDSRKSYTKIDWELWTATIADKNEDFRTIVDAIGKWVNETPSRVPMTDWYDTITGKQSGFQARSVVGGLFIPFLRQPELWKKYASRDKTAASSWAAADFSLPTLTVIVPAADTQPATWRYTTSKPAGRWMAANYSDATWSSGKSGFGTEGTPGAHVHTRWDTDDIWIRREIELPEAKLHDARLFIHHDEDAEIYLNGVLAARPRGFVAEYVTVPISQPAMDTLHSGKNVIAVHCHQTTGGQYIDVGIVEMSSAKKQH